METISWGGVRGGGGIENRKSWGGVRELKTIARVRELFIRSVFPLTWWGKMFGQVCQSGQSKLHCCLFCRWGLHSCGHKRCIARWLWCKVDVGCGARRRWCKVDVAQGRHGAR